MNEKRPETGANIAHCIPKHFANGKQALSNGLSLNNSLAFDLDYRLHYETGLLVADFNDDGRLDIAALGNTKTGVGAGGPLAVYVYLQETR